MRGALTALAIWFCALIPALAQDTARLPLVGVMRTGAAANNEPFATLFREELATLGDAEGRNVRLDFRFSDGDDQRFPEMAEALVKEKATVIVVFNQASARAAQHATRTIPIIAVAGDFVAEGLGASLAKPGGNITGVSLIEPELEAKRLEIMKEMLPAAWRFAVLSDRDVLAPARLRAVEDGARALGVQLQTVDVRSPADFGAAFEAFRAGGAEAVDILGSSMLFNFRDQLGALASAYKLPAICLFPEMVVAGCLASYGTSLRELSATLADLTDKMLKGASPADTPARQPTKFELVINLKVARALGIEIPPAILARAEEVIE
jgi:putative ABC transport system substrate-binding protein